MQLTVRWKTNPKLKKWWQALGEAGKVAWFLKWQGLESKRRFEFIQYVEMTIEVQEVLEDEIDEWITFSTYHGEKFGKPGMTLQVIEQMWKEAIESCKSECRYARGEWLLPRFMGFRRITRQRRTQGHEAMRLANITDPNQMETLWAGGAQSLARHISALQAPVVSQPAVAAPHVAVQPSDMPVAPMVIDTMREVIAREAVSSKNYLLASKMKSASKPINKRLQPSDV